MGLEEPGLFLAALTPFTRQNNKRAGHATGLNTAFRPAILSPECLIFPSSGCLSHFSLAASGYNTARVILGEKR